MLAEHAIFRLIKRAEMKELLGSFADGQIAMHKVSDAGVSLMTATDFSSVPQASQAAWDK